MESDKHSEMNNKINNKINSALTEYYTLECEYVEKYAEVAGYYCSPDVDGLEVM